MTRLGKFFRNHLGKYFLNSPLRSSGTEQREGISEPSNKDPDPTSPLDERIAAASSQSNKLTVSKAGNEDQLLKAPSKTSSKFSNKSTIKVNSRNPHQVGKQSTIEFSLVLDTKTQLSNSSKPVGEKSGPNELNKKRHSNEDSEISLSPVDDHRLIELNKPDSVKSVPRTKSPLECESSGSQSGKNTVLASYCPGQSRSIKQATETKCDPHRVVTGTTESVQAPYSTQSDLASKNTLEPKGVTNAEIPIHITAPEFVVKSNPAPKTKPENVADPAPQSSRSAKTLTPAGQRKDMVARSQHVPAPSSHKLSQLPSNSASLRTYLESTSARRSSPGQVISPNKSPVVSNRPSYISSPRPTSPRPSDKNFTAVKGQTAPLRPSSSKNNSEINFAKDVPKEDEECPHKVEDNEETAEKSPEILEEDISLVTLVEVSDSTKEVIESAMKRFGMKEVNKEGYWNVRWSDNGVSIQLCQKLQKYQRINRFPGSGLLMTKNNLAKTTTKMKQTFPQEYDFVPETWCLSGEISKVEQYARAHDRDCFIIKPNDGSSGKGIIITRNIAKLKMCEKMVCQVYIRKPYLIDGYKFDLRIYTLITSCRPLRLFIYNEGLARFATQQYEEPNQQNETNRYMHLTNYAVNKRSPSYTVDETKGTLRRLTTINKWLMRHNVDAKKVWESMDDAIVKTIISFLPALRHNYRVSFPEQTNSNSCFQILGFDIIFDENLKPYVLEVNDSPSFKADVPLDKEMTESLIHDTFNILHLDENNRSKVLNEEKRQSRMRLLSASTQNRNAIYKEKEQNERLLTQSRIEWENTHTGNFRKVFPNDQKMKHYKKFIRASQDIFLNHS